MKTLTILFISLFLSSSLIASNNEQGLDASDLAEINNQYLIDLGNKVDEELKQYFDFKDKQKKEGFYAIT